MSTAGLQRPDNRMPEDMPDRTPDRMSERMPEDMPDKVPECLPDRMPEDMPDRMPEGMPDKVPECLPEHMPEDLPDRMPDRMSEDIPEDVPDRVPEDMPEDMPDRMPADMPNKMPEDMSDRMPEDLPVTKRIDVTVGITRSKVIYMTCFFMNKIVVFGWIQHMLVFSWHETWWDIITIATPHISPGYSGNITVSCFAELTEEQTCLGTSKGAGDQGSRQ